MQHFVIDIEMICIDDSFEEELNLLHEIDNEF